MVSINSDPKGLSIKSMLRLGMTDESRIETIRRKVMQSLQ